MDFTNSDSKYSKIRNILAEIQKTARFHSRRLWSILQYFSAGYHSTGPIMFLITSTAIGVATTLSTLYATSYMVEIDGNALYVVSDHTIVERALLDVEKQGKSLFGEDYVLENQVEYQFGLHLKSDLADSTVIAHYLYSQLEELGSALGRYAVMLQGKQVAVIESEEELEKVLDDILEQFTTEFTISADFVETVSLKTVYDGDFVDTEALTTLLTENTTGETTYTVVSGDTFNAIAYNHDMSVSELMNLNPQMDPDRLYVGNQVNVKEVIPLLSVITVDTLNYTQSIPCPVEEVSDPNSYVGSSKIIQAGVEGEADVTANVTYINGREKDRDVLESVVLSEPTKTVRAVGTAERPKSASYGSYIWPASGRISSYFGGRQLYGVYNYHSGLDIAAPYGTPVYAADGGTVSFSGWRASYGNLVIITHDNGAQTYYAHNSSLLVSSGQKVYRGQQIAKIGSTGNSTGNHLHFEIRIGGKAVNPLGYLP